MRTTRFSKEKNKQRFDKREGMKKETVLRTFVINKQTPLLEFLLANLNQSRNNCKSLLSHHKILVDGASVSQFDYLLQRKQILQITKEPVRGQDKQDSKLPIIYEDDEIIVMNKPSGLLSVATDNENTSTAYRMLMDYVRRDDKRNRVYIVHRLDKETSGVFMIAKTPEVQEMLQKDWNKTVTKRGYYAVVEGVMSKKEDTIKSYLMQTRTHLMYSTKDSRNGELAITNYKVMKESSDYSLLDVKIDSGKKNQIRVHMADLGHTIVGDKKYESRKDPLKRLGLHAYELSFIHPITKKTYSFKADMPVVFNKLFK